MSAPDFALIRARLEQAGRLVESVSDAIADFVPAHLGEEIRRRELELAARSVSTLAVELVGTIGRGRRKLPIEVCPHCGWGAAPRSVPRCPRCNGVREIRHEGAGSVARRALYSESG